jgi:hypothetical protein
MDVVDKMFPTKCIVCEQEVETDPDAPGDDEKGVFPCIGGGTIEIDFGYFSRFDQCCREEVIQGIICDNCFESRQHLTRTVEVLETRKFVEPKLRSEPFSGLRSRIRLTKVQFKTKKEEVKGLAILLEGGSINAECFGNRIWGFTSKRQLTKLTKEGILYEEVE